MAPSALAIAAMRIDAFARRTALACPAWLLRRTRVRPVRWLVVSPQHRFALNLTRWDASRISESQTARNASGVSKGEECGILWAILPSLSPGRPEMTDTDQSQLTQLLQQVNSGQDEALAQLMPVVYSELRRQAARYLRRERQNHTLQPTALVNEAFIKLIDQRNVRWQNRAHFFGIAAQAMRRIMVDHARARHRVKRGGVQQAVTLDEAMLAGEARSVDVLALDEALTRLAAIDERQAKIVELRYFAELSVEETAEVTGLSPATVKREWAMARAWLHAELTR